MANGDPGSYNQKEILTLFVLPALDEIKEKLDSKANATDLRKVEDRLARTENRVDNLSTATAELPGVIGKVNAIESKLTSPEKIAQIVEEGLQASKNRGWTTRERVLGLAIGIMTLVSLVLNLATR